MSARKTSAYPQNVFINCPFDDEYTPIFEAIVFTIFTCGFRFRADLPHILREAGIEAEEMEFSDLTWALRRWTETLS